MNITKDTIIGELVANDYRAASVFKKQKIDFCCQGNRSIGDACLERGIDQNDLLHDLQQAVSEKATTAFDYKSWPADLLADYIEKKHHRYVEAKIQEILPYLDKVVRVHGGKHPELFEIQDLFKQSANELTTHMKKEELVLFPHIRKMVQSNGNYVAAAFHTVQNPIEMMHHEHDTEGERFRKISYLTNGYQAPLDACNTFMVTYALLKEFEDDLHEHIHLENNILFPTALTMEENMGQCKI